jgi:hypothetical protein
MQSVPPKRNKKGFIEHNPLFLTHPVGFKKHPTKPKKDGDEQPTD